MGEGKSPLTAHPRSTPRAVCPQPGPPTPVPTCHGKGQESGECRDAEGARGEEEEEEDGCTGPRGHQERRQQDEAGAMEGGDGTWAATCWTRTKILVSAPTSTQPPSSTHPQLTGRVEDGMEVLQMFLQLASCTLHGRQHQLQAPADVLQLLHHLLHPALLGQEKGQVALCTQRRWTRCWDELGKLHPGVSWWKKSWEWGVPCSYLVGNRCPELFPACGGGQMGQPRVLWPHGYSRSL